MPQWSPECRWVESIIPGKKRGRTSGKECPFRFVRPAEMQKVRDRMDVKHSAKKQLALRPEKREEEWETCHRYLCGNGINSERTWRQYALKNHPDKIGERRTPASDRLFVKLKDCWERKRATARVIAGENTKIYNDLLKIDCSDVELVPPLGHSFYGSSPRSDSDEPRAKSPPRLRLNAPPPRPPSPPRRRPGLVMSPRRIVANSAETPTKIL